MKAMEHKGIDFWVGICSGMAGGVTSYICQINLDVDFLNKLIQASIIAVVSGIGGAAGSAVFKWIKKKLKK